MRGQSVSQNMKKPSRRLLPIEFTQPRPARSTASISQAPDIAVAPPFPGSRVHQARDRGRDLLQNFDAVPVLVDHPLESPYLAFDTSQALLDCFLLVAVAPLHPLPP